MQKAILPQLHGVVVLNKPKGVTSNHCLQELKHMGQKKIGHAGTLDPLASGVLLVLLGQATKLSFYLLREGGKTYRGKLSLGRTTDTWDSEGTLVEEKPWEGVSPNAVLEGVADWVHLKEQPVPPYSAAKKDGQPLYKLARKGTIVERTKHIEIRRAEVLSQSLPLVEFRVECSSGTYIRSLAHSLGMRLGCGAVLTELVREFSYPFGIEDAVDLSAILENPGVLVRTLRPIRTALPSWPSLTVPEPWRDIVKTGQSIPASCFTRDVYRDMRTRHAVLMDDECELALATYEPGEAQWKITRGLWTNA
ncbi:MAG: tRNA pseudouridine(55) synthase TruB [Desulfovibrionaceae bacterium]|nr:tRNA pseudouridine(55) synthase TruB [Desulfovibrionaceae bacterium]